VDLTNSGFAQVQFAKRVNEIINKRVVFVVDVDVIVFVFAQKTAT